MKTHWGAIAVGAVLVVTSIAGCASRPGSIGSAPTSEATVAAPVTPEPSLSPAPDPAADARAQAWMDSLPVPPAAKRVEDSPSSSFSMISTAWLCNPTIVKDAYWGVDGMSLPETTRWMSEHPAPGLFSSLYGPISDDRTSPGAMTSFGLTPQENDPFQGIFVVIAQTEHGSAIHAQAGTYPESAVCPTPEPGTSFGGLGQG